MDRDACIGATYRHPASNRDIPGAACPRHRAHSAIHQATPSQRPACNARQNASFPVQFAGSAKWHHGPQRLARLADEGIAIEFTPNPQDLAGMDQLLAPSLARQVPLRLHGYFPGHEFGDVCKQAAASAMDLHCRFLERADAIVPGATMTCHIGLTPNRAIDRHRAEDNLGLLVRRARQLGQELSIENLKQGPSSDPKQILTWARATDAAITLDLGHALSSKTVQDGHCSVHAIIDRFSERLIEAHYYERETTRHHRPEDMGILGPLAEHLLSTDCRWWTIELDKMEDILHTRSLTVEHLATIGRGQSEPCRLS